MSDEVLGIRIRSLEELFFAKHNQKLLQQLREKEEALVTATVQVERIRQIGSVFKTLIRWGAAVAIAFIGTRMIVALYAKPAWIIALSILVPAAVSIFRPWKWVAAHKKYMVNHQQRLIRLEKEIDPNRSSSGLDEEGIGPHDLD